MRKTIAVKYAKNGRAGVHGGPEPGPAAKLGKQQILNAEHCPRNDKGGPTELGQFSPSLLDCALS
jgi:hypothetical protein